jgi:hypothetical protein
MDAVIQAGHRPRDEEMSRISRELSVGYDTIPIVLGMDFINGYSRRLVPKFWREICRG